MSDFIIILFVVIIVALASIYIYKEKKKGNKCIGCPHSKECKMHNCGYSK